MAEKIRILMIDDDWTMNPDPDARTPISYYREALEEAGFEVSGVAGWDEAAPMFKNANEDLLFDLVVLDITMPLGKEIEDDGKTNGGVFTGLAISQILSDKEQYHVILSNMLFGQFPTGFESKYLLESYLKPQTTPRALAALLAEFFEQ